MNSPCLSLLARSIVVAVVPIALVVGAASPAVAVPPSTTFGSHVSVCAHMSTGFSGAHNPSHHRGPTATHATYGLHC